jgi:hypothetical protein
MKTKEEQIGDREHLELLTSPGELHIGDLNNDPVKILEHIAVCESCEAFYINHIAQHAMIKAPMDLKKNILREIEKTERKSLWEIFCGKKYPYRLKFLSYSMNVSLAVSGAILLLFLIPMNAFSGQDYGYQKFKETSSISSFISKMNNNIEEVSNNVLKHTDGLLTSDFSNKGGNEK